MPIKIDHSTHSGSAMISKREPRELAAKAQALAAGIAARDQDIRTADEAVRRAGFRCCTAIGSVRQAARDLRGTAADLDRIATAAVPGTCCVPRGAHQEHGNTLISNGGRTWCRDAACRRKWNYGRGGLAAHLSLAGKPYALNKRWTHYFAEINC